MKNIDCLFLHERRLIIDFLLEKIDKLATFLFWGCHWFDVLKVERILPFSSGYRSLVYPGTVHHVGVTGGKAISRCIIISRMVPVCNVPDYVISVTGTRGWVGSYFNSLVFNFLEVHLLRGVISCRISFSNAICSVAHITISSILQI